MRRWGQGHTIITGKDGPLRCLHNGIRAIRGDVRRQGRSLATAFWIGCEHDYPARHRLALKRHHTTNTRCFRPT